MTVQAEGAVLSAAQASELAKWLAVAEVAAEPSEGTWMAGRVWLRRSRNGVLSVVVGHPTILVGIDDDVVTGPITREDGGGA